MLRTSIKKILTLCLFFLTALASHHNLFTENDLNTYDDNTEETYQHLHLRAIYFCPQPYKWKVWINKTCISSCEPRSIQGWNIVQVNKESIVIRKGKKEKTLFVQKNKTNKKKITNYPEKEKIKP